MEEWKRLSKLSSFGLSVMLVLWTEFDVQGGEGYENQ